MDLWPFSLKCNSIHKMLGRTRTLQLLTSVEPTLCCVFSQILLIINTTTNESRARGTVRADTPQASIVPLFTLAEVCGVTRAAFVLRGCAGSPIKRRPCGLMV